MQNKPLRVLQISDPHLFARQDQKLLNVSTDASLQGVIRHIQEYEEKTDMVLATGDIAQDGSNAAYQRFLDLVRPLAPVLRGLPGNHDANDAFYSAWGEHAQAVTDAGHWRLVLLDSSIPESSFGHIAQEQFDLLIEAIGTSEGRHILIAIHHNPVPVGSTWLDSMMIDNGHELLEMAQRNPAVRGIIWGHVHQNFETVYNLGTTRPYPLHLLSAPATCLQFEPHSSKFSLDDVDPGYRRLSLYEDGRIETEVVRVPGLNIRPDTRSEGY